MFGTSGIRGPVGETVTADLGLSVGRALGVETERVVLGRDPRESGPVLADALSAGLRESGTDVFNLGVAATPTVARAVDWLGADAGAVVTASHNPAPDNGIKLFQPGGQAFDEARRGAITDRLESGETSLADWDALGTESTATATDRHVRAIADAVSLDRADDPLRVVVDVGNGAGGVTVEALQELGCAVETLNAQPDGRFPGRPSEPTAENCTALATLVGSSDADLGIAHDGDADRTRVVAADGTFLSGDVTLAILAAATAESGDRVSLPVDTSLAVEDHLDRAGIAVERTPVGDVYVAEAARNERVVFGGEPSGAWIWPDQSLAPDGPLAAAKLAALAAERPLVDRAAGVETYPIRRTSVETEDKAAVMDRLREQVRDEYDRVSTLDGIRVDEDDGWFLLRASGTEPVVRVTAEARSPARAEEVFETAQSELAAVR